MHLGAEIAPPLQETMNVASQYATVKPAENRENTMGSALDEDSDVDMVGVLCSGRARIQRVAWQVS